MNHYNLTQIEVEARRLRAQHVARLFRTAGESLLRLFPSKRPAARTA
ncbi:RSP_7527 family protein [Roseitranquillus sediminis]|nr:hypothetical protein [Roseitranquillus sediminis]MBM9594143.1 hypothetical protein [Roseitranquillus sediminis]